MTNLTQFANAEAQFNATFNPTVLNGRSVMRWEGDSQYIPLFIRTGEYNCGMPSVRKWFDHIDFHGEGTAQVRVYLDGAFISQSTLTAQEASNLPRRLNLPVGSKGYGLAFELVGPYFLRAVELTYNPLPSVMVD